MADKTSDAIKLNLRLPKSLHKQLQQRAKRHNVSLNTEIVTQLEGFDIAAIRQTTEAIEPLLITIANRSASIAAEMVLSMLKPEAVDKFRKDLAKAGIRTGFMPPKTPEKK